MDSQALPLEILILRLRQVWDTLGILFPWRSFRVRADLKAHFLRGCAWCLYRWEWPPWENFIFSWIVNTWLIHQKVVQEVVWPRRSPGKIRKLLNFSLSPALFNFVSSSYLALFLLLQCPFPSVLDVFPGFQNTYSLSHSYSWIGVKEWRSVLTDKVWGEEN